MKRDFHEYEPCDHCDELVHCDDMCEVPYGHRNESHPVTEWFRYCCHKCYDEVCAEEGYDPQTGGCLI